jgi:LmbE family N-acetylglucosaminyl deacetylase
MAEIVDEVRVPSEGRLHSSPRELRTRFLLGRLQATYGPAAAEAPPAWSDAPPARVLVVASHADDEVIGCGGLIQHCLRAGSEVTVLFVTHSRLPDGSVEQRRIDESCQAQAILGYQHGEHLGFEEKSLLASGTSFSDLVYALSSGIRRHAPELLLIPNHTDFHHDHATVGLACRQVLAAREATDYVRRPPAALVYEIWGPCAAHVRLPLPKPMIEAKRRALECYASQLEQVDYQSIMDFIQDFRATGATAAECYERLEVTR